MTAQVGLFAIAPVADDSGVSGERPTEKSKGPELACGSAEEFLHEQLLPTYIRDADSRTEKWCLEWYFHPDVSRFERCVGRGNTSG